MSTTNKKSFFEVCLIIGFSVCALFGAINIWNLIFPPTMTANCAYLINKYPLEQFSYMDETSRDSVVECLYLSKKIRSEDLDS
jgi:hypothetical protein